MNKENSVLSDYEIKGILGKGTFSKVKLAFNKISNEKVAIKIIDKQFTLNKNNYERIKREISILKSSYHPNIIKVLDIKEDSTSYYFVMEYCQYGELFLHIINNRRLDDKQAAFFFFQLINGLNYLHINTIVHRDLKPENILLAKGKILKIIDFGLSNYSSDNQYLNTPCGSPSYASPEMIRGKKYNGFLSDIWSCGVILYVMLCGYLPFDGFNNNELFKKILKCKVNYPNNIDKSAIDLMKNILVANPDKRMDIYKIKSHPFYLKGRNIFKQKYPDLINEVEQAGLIYINKTLKKSISDPFNENIININHKNRNLEKENNYHNERNNNLNNSVNKNENNKENNYLEKNNEIKNNENNLYHNLLCTTKNINYYKKILSGRLNVHNIKKNKNKLEENNEITPKNQNIFSNNKISRSISKNSEKLSVNNRNQKKISSSNSVNSKEPRKKNLEIYLKTSPLNKNNKKFEKNDSVNAIMDKLDNEQDVSEEKKRISTVTFNDNNLKTKYGCLSPNFLLLKKLLKNSQNQEEEKDTNNIQESIVYNAQKETQIFNINHTINKIKKLKRIYENEISNVTGNEKKNKEYISSNNSNSNFTLNAQKAKIRTCNDNPKNNYIIKKNLNKNNYNLDDCSPLRKIGSIFNTVNSKGKIDSKKTLSNFNSCSNTNKKNNINNNELIIYDNNYFINENNKENSVNHKKTSQNHNRNINLDANNNIFQKNSNRPRIYIQSPKKKSQNNINKYNRIIDSDRNDIKYIKTNINSLDKSPIINKIKYNLNKNYSNSIKVNKKQKNSVRNKKNEEKKNIENKCSLTNKLNSIKKNFNIGNKDIFILDNKKEAIINYISNHNKKIDSTRSQKYINNRSHGETINMSIKKDTSKKRNQYSSLKDNNSIYSEKQIRQIKTNNSNKDLIKIDMKNRNSFGLFNQRFNFLKKNKNMLFNDENQNYNTKEQNKNKYISRFEKNHKNSNDYTLSKEYSNIEKNSVSKNSSYHNQIKININRSLSVKKECS